MVSCALALCCVKYSPIYTRRQESVFTGVFVCLSVFRTISQKAMQLGSPNLTQKCSTMSPGNPFISGQKFKGQGHESIGMGLCTLVSAGFFKFQDAFGVRLISKYLMKSSLKISPHLKCVAALPCEIFDTFLSVRWPLIFLSAALSMVLCLYDRPLQVCVLSKRLIGLIWILAQKLPPPAYPTLCYTGIRVSSKLGYYPLELCPKFWNPSLENFTTAHQTSQVLST